MEEKRQATLSELIRGWIDESSGWWDTKQLDTDLKIGSAEGKNVRRVVIHTLVKDGKVTRHSNRQGSFRRVDDFLDETDWQSADTRNILPLIWPFGLEQLVKIYPKSIVIIAGSKDAGKTAFLYNFVHLNMDLFDVDLFNNETGREQMKERFEGIGGIPVPAPFKVYERYDNFVDVIHPDHISVIDYMDLNSEVYMVGDEIDKVWRKLQKGAAVIGLQKPPGRDLAYGGAFSAKRSTLYVALDSHRLKVVVGKNPMPKQQPVGMQWKFSFNGCGSFDNIQRFYGGDGGE